MSRITNTLLLGVCAVLPSLAYADQGSFTNSGGSTSVSSGVAITSNVATPGGTLTLNCPTVSAGVCAGGSFTYLSSDGTTTIGASFTSGTFKESCSGGGRGGQVTCSYSFTGYITGTLTVNGLAQLINGATYQGFGTGGAAAKGTTIYNSAYTPFYYSDSQQIHRSDDLQGTNQISFGSQGGAVGQFYGAYGIALDPAGRIYVADTYNCRIVRIDDMNGTNWNSFGGTCGSDQGQFYNPSGIAVDSAGKIYVTDTGNSRVVRMDDMNGANWISYGTVGTDVGQFSQSLTSVTVDAGGHIYIPDTGNRRLVRIDDMTGANWMALTQSAPVNGVSYYSFQSPVAVSLDSAGRIFVADNEFYQPAVVRVDDMTGTNWTFIYTGSGSGLNSISVDSSGTVFTGGGGVKLVDNMAGILTSSSAIGPLGPYYVFAVTPLPLPSPPPSAIKFSPVALTFANQNIGTSSASQSVTIANFGGSPLNFSSFSVNGGFGYATDCPNSLVAGANCTVNVSFAPSVSGPANGLLTLSDDSGNLGGSQAVTLTGLGTAPMAYVAPGSLDFPGQLMNTTSAAESVVLQNTGTGPMRVASVTATALFSQTNNCGVSIVPGSACTILVSFTPTVAGSAAGTLTIVDDAGTQNVSLTGIGSSSAPQVNVSPSSLLFPQQLVGTNSARQGVTVTNTGTPAVTNNGVTVSGDFAETTTCTTSIAAGGSCTITVTFTPSAAGTRTGTLTLNLSTGMQTVSLTGTGSIGSQPSVLSLSPATLNFSGYTIGDNPRQTVIVTNTSGASVGIAGIVMSGDPSLTQANSCGSVMAAGATCSITVTFRPVAYGTFNSTLTVTESSGAQDTVSVTGTGVPDS